MGRDCCKIRTPIPSGTSLEGKCKKNSPNFSITSSNLLGLLYTVIFTLKSLNISVGVKGSSERPKSAIIRTLNSNVTTFILSTLIYILKTQWAHTNRLDHDNIFILSQNTCKKRLITTPQHRSITSMIYRWLFTVYRSHAIASFTLTAATNAAKAKHGFTILPATGLVSLKAL